MEKETIGCKTCKFNCKKEDHDEFGCYHCECEKYIPCLRPDTCEIDFVNGEFSCKLCYERDGFLS